MSKKKTIDKKASKVKSEDKRWERIQSFLEEVGLVCEYLRYRILCERFGEQTQTPPSPLCLIQADQDRLFSEDLITTYLEAISRQGRAGFVISDKFPVFGTLKH